ncbi:MAG: hypothetical protein MZV64_04160 [Ignavibacteriales bacterium]|nr:hypothetical protein [Ignavibacteriales bacterium]
MTGRSPFRRPVQEPHWRPPWSPSADGQPHRDLLDGFFPVVPDPYFQD